MNKIKYLILIINVLVAILLLSLVVLGKSEGFFIILPIILFIDSFLVFKNRRVDNIQLTKATSHITIGWLIMYIPIGLYLLFTQGVSTGGGYELYYIVGIPLLINLVLHLIAYWKFIRARKQQNLSSN